MATATPAMLCDELGTMLVDGVQAARTLSVHLASEREALEQDDLDALRTAATGKAEALARLETLERQRLALLGSAGLADDDAGMSRLAERAGDIELRGAWQRYLDIAGNCRQQNQVNGAIIRLRQQQVQAQLQILTGAGSAATYGPQGADPTPASRTLGEA